MTVERLTTFQKQLKTENIAAAFIQGKENIFYLTGFRTDPHERIVALIVLPDEEPFLIVPGMEKPLVQKAGWTHTILTYSDTDQPWSILGNALSRYTLSGDSIWVEKRLIPLERAEQLQQLLGQKQLLDAEPALMQLRSIKSEDEIAHMRKAAQLADFGVEIGVGAIAEGRTEIEILAKIEYELTLRGINEMAFQTTVISGANSADPHGKPSNKAIQHGDLVLFDLGVVVEGYCSDITRTVAFGELSDSLQTVYQTVLEANQAAISICKPGTELGALDRKARSIITEAGFGEQFPHRLGHGLGTDVHELPSINETNTDKLQAGMTFTIEPGIYLPNQGGVRIEDDVLITKDGYELLTKYPKELQIIRG
ncbi:M24 family metallopeptidase [Alkalicoccobacillus porphyridii]|uniref:Aminopeptidase P family protein n=1 Tax=Alkalicoccobacillus porphyridii TaxID=2597270 RepID=A0A554A2X6_9BACI|nr:Xaa-Pro peptidase family protein [Alkalicoccobacillus porphyridii]TSB48051.1 aminopeptidase P family protein [Alkalicoccobacillus porphyridii]